MGSFSQQIIVRLKENIFKVFNFYCNHRNNYLTKMFSGLVDFPKVGRQVRWKY